MLSSPSTICSPAWATPRTPERPTDGALTARLSAAAGRPFIPWQRAWADVLGERDPVTGRLVYSRAVMIVPRRAGKSALALARALTVARRRAARAMYCSAHREAAARLWRDEWFPELEASPLGRYLRVTRGNGQESIAYRKALGGSTFRLVAASGPAIRSAAAALVEVDEALELSVEVGDALEAAVFPTQATIAGGGQTLIMSSAGHEASEWLRRWRDLGRAAVEEGRRERIAYLEYAAPPDADPLDEATWWAAHPGLGHHVHIEALRADAETFEPDVFAREYLGRWPEHLGDTRLLEAWAAGEREMAAPTDPVAFAVELDEERTTCSILAAGAGVDDTIVLEVLEHRPHGAWVGPRLVELAERWSPVGIGWDAGGPANALAPDFADAPAPLFPLRTNDVTAAAGSLYDALLARRVTHRADTDLDTAVSAARRRRAGGAWLFDRRIAAACPLIAGTLAAWILRDVTARPPGVT